VQSSTGKTDWTDWQEQEQNKRAFSLCGVPADTDSSPVQVKHSFAGLGIARWRGMKIEAVLEAREGFCGPVLAEVPAWAAQYSDCGAAQSDWWIPETRKAAEAAFASHPDICRSRSRPAGSWGT
jgi:hypothetical protein